MVNNVKLGTINMPKLMRNLSNRTRQVRDLVFHRDAIYSKAVGTKKDADGSPGAGGGRTTDLAGPAVSFGYETSTNTTQATGTDQAYHLSTPALHLPGLTALQSPVISRSGKLEQSGHRITGACTFYLPSLDYIRALDNFSETTQFDEIETYDKLLDIERVIINPDDYTGTTASKVYTFSDKQPGYEIDRVQFKIKTSGTLDYILLTGNEDSSATTLKWDGNLALSSSVFTTIDLPITDIVASDTTLVYKDGVASTFTAAVTGSFNINKLYGDSNNELSSLTIALTGSASVELKDIYLYKSAEWRVENIKDYRDEYIEIGALRLRGERTSLRRANG
jgi:hypothetical protein